MISAKEAADMLGVSRSKMYDLAASGKVASYRFDGALRFERADLDTYKESCRSVSTAQTSAGVTSLTATLRGADTELASYFRKAGLAPKRTRSTGRNPPGSTPLQLVSASRSP